MREPGCLGHAVPAVLLLASRSQSAPCWRPFQPGVPLPAPLSVLQIHVAVPGRLPGYSSALTEAKLPPISDKIQGKNATNPASPGGGLRCPAPGGEREGAAAGGRCARVGGSPEPPPRHSAAFARAFCC